MPGVDKAGLESLTKEVVTCFPQSFTGLPGHMGVQQRALSSEAGFGAPDGCSWPFAGAWTGRERKGGTGSLIKRHSLSAVFLLLKGEGRTCS